MILCFGIVPCNQYREYWLVTCLFVVDIHQGDSGETQSSKLPEIGPGPRLGTDHVFGNFHTLWSLSPAVEGVDTVPYYAIEDARESWAPLAVAVSDKSWSDLKSRGEVTLDIKVLPPLPIIYFPLPYQINIFFVH